MVSAVAPNESSLIGLVSIIAPIIAGGNTVVVLASDSKPLCSITFAEVLRTSDVPGGVVNILTGHRSELLEHFSSHMDVNAIVYCGTDNDEITLVQQNAALNVKRPIVYSDKDWMNNKVNELLDVNDGSVIMSRKVEGSDIYGMVDQLADFVIEDLNLGIIETVDLAVSKKTSPNMTAYTHYVNGNDYLNRGLCWRE